ncbi:hypothetical protein LP415_18615 [Polaromonas sp. P1(28)-8]|nr:hypothetical protein LP415_18615 [Polaromonas sp. P1(28)-8]
MPRTDTNAIAQAYAGQTRVGKWPNINSNIAALGRRIDASSRQINLETDFRVTQTKIGERRNKSQSEIGCHGNTQVTAGFQALSGKLLMRTFHRLQNLLTSQKVVVPLLRKLDLFGGSFEQAQANFALKRRNSARDRGLGHFERHRGARNAFQLGHFHKNRNTTQQIRTHRRFLISFKRRIFSTCRSRFTILVRSPLCSAQTPLTAQ